MANLTKVSSDFYAPKTKKFFLPHFKSVTRQKLRATPKNLLYKHSCILKNKMR